MKNLGRYIALLAGAAFAGLALLGIATTTNAQEESLGAAQPSLTLVSIPDFVNADVGDVRGIRRPGDLGWDLGDPNSINDHYRNTLNVVLNQVASENPDAVLVAGDEVMGHWGEDTSHTGIFGPVNTYQHQKQVLRNAGRFYYGQWKDRFAQRGIKVYPAVGDHDIGDNPWPRGSFENRAFNPHRRHVGTGHARQYRVAWQV
jgi:3',5'-cyclic AMP phosphodiesterase CpdA